MSEQAEQIELAGVLSPKALVHWNDHAQLREKWGAGVCVCYLCESMPSILRALAGELAEVPKGYWITHCLDCDGPALAEEEDRGRCERCAAKRATTASANKLREVAAKANRLGSGYVGWDCDGSAAVCEERTELIDEVAALVGEGE